MRLRTKASHSSREVRMQKERASTKAAAGLNKTSGHRKQAVTPNPGLPLPANNPVFAQPVPSPDPTSFKDPVTDQNLKEVSTVEAVPLPADGLIEPVLTLAEALGAQGASRMAAILASFIASVIPAVCRGLRRSPSSPIRW